MVVRAAALTRAAAVAALTVTAAAASLAASDAGNGWRLEARCRDGRAQGPYRLVDAHGQLRVAGAFDEGVRTSSFFFWRENGVRAAQVPYDDNGVRQGTLATWYDGRPGREPTMRFEAQWQHGMRAGEARSWYPDGRLRTRAEYAAGAIVQAEAWSADGTPIGGDAARDLALHDAAEDDAEYALRDALIREHMPRCD